MPHVEVLPNSATAAAPGWTYIVDTGYDPSRVAINPKDRKRAAARPRGPRGDNELSARQQTAIARRIAELERDNDPKQSILVPGKFIPKTPNAKRILQSQRQIKHWLDEEEAMLQQAPPPRATTTTSRTATKPPRKLSTLTSVPPTPSEATTPGPIPSGVATPIVMGGFGERAPQEDPTLSITSSMPPALDPKELEALLAAPPLSYAASHAAPPAPGGPPQRYFCDNCGYWGKIKCLKCGARVCGLECKDAHEATRCLKWA
ncbi:hypothetical protein K469DRAFT_696290 [Zopfia rhizophila CBS 207.26]|uniref:HIT-type domain-containing protein n=1 Tax=Zopfia rhizophila CBS 207.26 TaxID=1314779 RepID=A0A6A6DHM6_9PEZI|nr:hypothetical protein K469DRAFT_696290 [Zopfia rhizophila CBS 207.26]